MKNIHGSVMKAKSSLLLENARPLLKKLSNVKAAVSLLEWDQETYMPSGSSQHRGEQITILDSISHELLTSKNAEEICRKFKELDLASDRKDYRILKVFAREHEIAMKIPSKLVEDLSRSKSMGLKSWKRAKSDKDFKIFAGDLSNIVSLMKEYAECIGYNDSPYDALLEEYEPGMVSKKLDIIFANLKKGLQRLLESVNNSNTSFNEELLKSHYPKDKQIRLSKIISSQLGFDYSYGRLDISVHPFSLGITGKDVRITTRINEENFIPCLMSTIHETGHGLYEQGIDFELYETPAAEGASLGIHESQSQIWEKIIGRTPEFSLYLLPLLKENFQNQFTGIDSEELFKVFNIIKPSSIRTEADELTYDLHIILRYEIEKDLIEGNLEVNDIPGLWNTKMRHYLGITPEDDSEGCLQDIHWSFGAFGYFPTYTLGKIYAAMFWHRMQIELPNIKSQIRNGQFSVARNWLKDKIHSHGKLYEPAELVKMVTGKELSSTDFLNYLEIKINKVYS